MAGRGRRAGKGGNAMPTYEYECLKCGKDFELFQSITEPPRQRCPKCRGKVKRRIGGGSGLLFKGSGFYATDYRSEGYRKSAKEDSGSATPKKETTPPKGGGKKEQAA